MGLRDLFSRGNGSTFAGGGIFPYAGVEFDGDGDGQLEFEDFDPTIGIGVGFGIGKIFHW